MARVGNILKRLLGPNSMARQFFVWNILGETLSAAARPFFIQLSNTVNSIFPVAPLTPEELVGLRIRGIYSFDQAAAEAKKSGLSPERFRDLTLGAGEPPSLGDMLHLYRLGKVTEENVIKALRQSTLKDEWIPTVLKLGLQVPSPEAILEALLQGQIDEPGARALYAKLSGDPEYFTLLYNTRGSSPTPLQAADMAHRGIIPWEGTGPGAVSYHQAFLEGPWRNKWIDSFRRASDYLPPPDTIVEMIRVGALDNARATDLLHRQGVPTDLIGAFLAKAVVQKTEKVKELTEGTISVLYREQAITDQQAMGMLRELNYQDPEAKFVLTSWRLARELAARNTAISTVHTQFINRRIDAGEASIAMDRFHVPANQRDMLIALWTEERKTKVAVLTAAQIRSAWKRDLFSTEDATSRLVGLGYDQQDAEVFLQLS